MSQMHYVIRLQTSSRSPYKTRPRQRAIQVQPLLRAVYEEKKPSKAFKDT